MHIQLESISLPSSQNNVFKFFTMGFSVPLSLRNTVQAHVAATETESENSKEPSILAAQNLVLGVRAGMEVMPL